VALIPLGKGLDVYGADVGVALAKEFADQVAADKSAAAADDDFARFVPAVLLSRAHTVLLLTEDC
jgi:hypothetical protein